MKRSAGAIEKCSTCPNMMRPPRTGRAEFPGTVSRTNATTCSACYQRNSYIPKNPRGAVGPERLSDRIQAFVRYRLTRDGYAPETVFGRRVLQPSRGNVFTVHTRDCVRELPRDEWMEFAE